MRSMSHEDEAEDRADAAGEETPIEDDSEAWLEDRLTAMEEARPEHAPPIHLQASGVNGIGRLELVQLAAFEAGEDLWWEAGVVTPFDPAVDAEGQAEGETDGASDEQWPDLERNCASPPTGTLRSEPLGLHQIHLDPRMAAGDHADTLGCTAAEIDGAPGNERSAIIDPHRDRTSIARVGHSHKAAKGQGLVSGCHGAHVKPFAIGGETAMEAAAIIGRDTRAEAAQDCGAARWLKRGEIDGIVGDPEVNRLCIRGERREGGVEIRLNARRELGREGFTFSPRVEGCLCWRGERLLSVQSGGGSD